MIIVIRTGKVTKKTDEELLAELGEEGATSWVVAVFVAIDDSSASGFAELTRRRDGGEGYEATGDDVSCWLSGSIRKLINANPKIATRSEIITAIRDAVESAIGGEL